jgi:thiol-disulfide isomerase/thioredoxin
MRRNYYLKYLLFFLLFCSPAALLAQSKFTVTITKSPELDSSLLKVSYDNGKEVINIPVKFENGVMKVSGEYYSAYATLRLMYPKGEYVYHVNRYYLSTKPAFVTFYSDNTKNNPIYSYQVKNAVMVDSLPEAKRLSALTKGEQEKLEVLHRNPDVFEIDSLRTQLEHLQKVKSEKKLAFIKANPKSYYALQLFRNEIVWDFAQSNPDSLLALFEMTFPPNRKQSLEGKEVVKLLKGRALVKGAVAPVFTANDINGKTIDLGQFRGKYVLLNFWATWCIPCVEKIPALKSLKDKYSTDTLEIISISSDEDLAEFQSGLKKYQMNWIQIYGNKDVINRYGDRPLPSLFLLNRAGEIVFNLYEDGDQNLYSRLVDLIGENPK